MISVRYDMTAALLAAVLLVLSGGCFSTVEGALVLDVESANCLSCHDSALAGDITQQVCPLPDCDHPIGVDYVLASAYNRGLRNPFFLNPAIRLTGNAIGCGTCHVPYSPDNHKALSDLRANYPRIPDPMLVMDNSGSALCLACHVK